MIDDLDASSSTLRLLVAEALRSWADDAVFDLVKDDDVVVRTAAARELHVRGGVTVLEKTFDLASAHEPFFREIAAFILGQLGTPQMPYKDQSLEVVMLLALDSCPDVRAAAAAAIGHLCYDSMPTEVEARLVELCNDEYSTVKCCAAFALGNSSGSPEARAALKKLLKQEDVYEYAELGIEILDEKMAG